MKQLPALPDVLTPYTFDKTLALFNVRSARSTANISAAHRDRDAVLPHVHVRVLRLMSTVTMSHTLSVSM